MPEDKLVILWTSGDREVALKMVFMYAGNAPRHGWWDDITLIVWGPSATLLAEDEELQDLLVGLKNEGVRLEACKACAEMCGVSDRLTALDVDVKYMGEALTSYIKEGRRLLTI